MPEIKNKEHKIRRDRDSNGKREVVCACGYVATGTMKKAHAAFDAHVRIQKAKGKVLTTPRAIASRLKNHFKRAIGQRSSPT